MSKMADKHINSVYTCIWVTSTARAPTFSSRLAISASSCCLRPIKKSKEYTVSTSYMYTPAATHSPLKLSTEDRSTLRIIWASLQWR